MEAYLSTFLKLSSIHSCGGELGGLGSLAMRWIPHLRIHNLLA